MPQFFCSRSIVHGLLFNESFVHLMTSKSNFKNYNEISFLFFNLTLLHCTNLIAECHKRVEHCFPNLLVYFTMKTINFLPLKRIKIHYRKIKRLHSFKAKSTRIFGYLLELQRRLSYIIIFIFKKNIQKFEKLHACIINFVLKSNLRPWHFNNARIFTDNRY